MSILKSFFFTVNCRVRAVQTVLLLFLTEERVRRSEQETRQRGAEQQKKGCSHDAKL